MIKIEDFTFLYSSKKGLKNINLELEPGNVYGLVGPNSAGKSTLLNVITGMYKSKGEVSVCGESNFKEFIKKIAYMTDDETLLQQNQTRILANIYKNENYFNYEYFLDKVKIFNLDLNNIMMSQYSRGQAKLLHCIYILSFVRNIYIFDEPLSNIDMVFKEKILDLILDKIDDDKLIIISSHELNDLDTKLDKVIFINDSSILGVEDLDKMKQLKNMSLKEIFIEKFRVEIKGDQDDQDL